MAMNSVACLQEAEEAKRTGRYRSRVLPPDEWPRLVGTEAESIWPLLDPDKAQVLVVEEGGVIMGCWVGFVVLHAECFWARPGHPVPLRVLRALLRGMREYAERLGYGQIATAADSDRIRRALTSLHAVALPVADHYVFRTDALPREKESLCQRS